MRVLATLAVIGFILTKINADGDWTRLLSAASSRPSWASTDTLSRALAQILLHSEPLTLALGLISIALAQRNLRENGISHELSLLVGGAAVAHAAASHHLNLPAYGLSTIVTCIVAFELVAHLRLSSLRLARNSTLAGLAAVVLNPQTTLLSVIVGSAVGLATAFLAKREHDICHLSVVPKAMPTALPAHARVSSIDDILARYSK